MISVIIPIHNTPIEFIEECFISMDKQTYKDFEVIIINDGSNWETTKYIRENSRQNYRIVEIEKSGISKALNIGIQISSNEILCRMDADDIMLPTRLELQYQFLEKNKQVDILGTQVELFGDQTGFSNHPLVVKPEIIIESDWFLNHPTVMYRKSSISKIGGYNSNFDGTEDLELWCRALSYGLSINNLSDVLVRHRRHKSCSTVVNDINRIIEINNGVRRHYIEKIIINKR
jgi:glycosyltransferase involved in cell wall biosynthesis